MDDLLGTVKERYAYCVSYRGFATLTHRANTHKPNASQENYLLKNRDFFNVLLPQFSSITQKIHTEIGEIIERREKAVLQTVNREMSVFIRKHTQAWKDESVRMEKMRAEAVKRYEKRVDLFNANTSKDMRLVKKEIEALKVREKARLQKQSQSLLDNPPMLHKAIKKAANEHADKEREQLQKELSATAEKAERRIIRKLRNEEQYEKRRRG